jgi:Holliday junction resolvase RusA-like endonuclease
MTLSEYEKLKLKMGKGKSNKKPKQKKKTTFVLPWPPSVNQMYATTQEGKRVLSKMAVKFYKECKPYFVVQNVPAFFGKTKMLIECFPNRSGGWDVSNLNKAIEDAIVKNEIIPDDQVKYLQPLAPVIHKKIENRFVKITLEEI